MVELWGEHGRTTRFLRFFIHFLDTIEKLDTIEECHFETTKELKDKLKNNVPKSVGHIYDMILLP